jgi:hypothetical protein
VTSSEGGDGDKGDFPHPVSPARSGVPLLTSLGWMMQDEGVRGIGRFAESGRVETTYVIAPNRGWAGRGGISVISRMADVWAGHRMRVSAASGAPDGKRNDG